MEVSTQTSIKKMVHSLRSILVKETEELFEGVFGLHKDGSVEDISQLPGIRDNEKAIKARTVFTYHIESAIGSEEKKEEIFNRLVLGVSFTHLNRLIALKLMERRGVIKDTISKGTTSHDFVRYIIRVLGKEDFYEVEDTDMAYQGFLLYQCHKVSEEIKVLFSPDDIPSYVFPRPNVLKEILDIINSEDLEEIWDKDETIGWFYQYFTPKELIKKARDKSPVPRNSRELAFRNQFYTPRYVVQYLTDNTLGRMWYEMRQKETELSELCQYMVKPPSEIFLMKDEKPSDNSEFFQVPFRSKKDPRELKILDPACGSGHFLLYVFDLLMVIYREAYEDAELSKKLKADYPDKEDFEKEIPRLILENNIYGIDIDLRAIQIASLALWLRAQREWEKMGILREDRPVIRKAHFILAEKMPGNKEKLETFVQTLKPALLGDFVREIWEKMKLAGEAGPLLQIEEDIKNIIKKAKDQWKALPSATQILFFEDEEEQSDFNLAGIGDETFFKEAENRILKSLKDYSTEIISIEKTYTRKLFSDEAIRGFEFIKALMERYDVILMNPPFGESSLNTKDLFQKLYPEWNTNILCAFIHRMIDLTNNTGFVGVIFDRTAIVKNTYEEFRSNILIGKNSIFSLVDTGWEVLDANVETTTMVLHKNISRTRYSPAFFFDVRMTPIDNKEKNLFHLIRSFNNRIIKSDVYTSYPHEFTNLPNSVIGYDWPYFLIKIFNNYKSIKFHTIQFVKGHTIISDQYQRCLWECNFTDIGINYNLFFNGGSYSLFYLPSLQVIPLPKKYEEMKKAKRCVFRNKDIHLKHSIAYGKRGLFVDYQLLRPKHYFSGEGFSGLLILISQKWYVLSVLNSAISQFIINKYCGQHKEVGYTNLIPIENNPEEVLEKKLSILSQRGYYLKFNWYLGDENNYQYEKSWLIKWLEKKDNNKSLKELLNDLISYEQEANSQLEKISSEIDSKTLELYGVTEPEDIAIIEKAVERRHNDVLWKETRNYSIEQKKLYHIESLVSFWVGCLFGRWDAVNGSFYDEKLIENGEIYDLRDAVKKKSDELWERDEIISEPVKFVLTEEEIKSCSRVKYPYHIDEDGIIPLDKGHSEDLVASIEKAAGITFGEENIEGIIKEIEEILGQDLRSYFTKKFFDTHTNRYLKKPIYWLLQSANRNYSIYLYYHKIDSDTFFKIVRNYVEPKINHVSNSIEDLNIKITSSKEREKRNLEVEKEKLEDVRQEIVEFKEKLEKIISIGLELDMDDGITVNISPFKDVILWNEVQKNWDDFEEGKYDWAKLAMKFWPERVKEKCKKDKSIAVMHGIE